MKTLPYYSLVLYFQGQPYKVKSYKILRINDLIQYFGYKNKNLVFDANKEICSFSDWSKVLINNSDQLEVLTIVGGG